MKGEPKVPRARGPILVIVLALFGLIFLSYVFGAAVMFFDLPSSGYLQKAFLGAQAWSEVKEATSPNSAKEDFPSKGVKIDKPGQTFDGFTLYMSASLNTSSSSTQAFLINMRGEEVHHWAIPFSRVWPKPPHISAQVNDFYVCFFGCHLFPNGDLLVVFHGLQNEGRGFGLAKLDKDSNVVWKYAANIHHDVDVGEDGTIYAVKNDLIDDLPKGLKFLHIPTLVDYLLMLSPEGKELKKPMPILEAFLDSPYSPLLSTIGQSREQGAPPPASPIERMLQESRAIDVLHTNCVRVLSRQLAPQFPLFKPGHVLISMRHLDTIAMMDPEKGSIVWAARGPWRGQHDPQFLDNGHLLIFDNLGSPRGSRVLEYDPGTQAFPWSYSADNSAPFHSSTRGMSQRLPNGNTFIVNSEGQELLEVTPSRNVVWSYSCDGFINTGRRYSAAQLPFLKGGPSARP